MGIALDPNATVKVGQKVTLGDLHKTSSVWVAGLGWDTSAVAGTDFDLDVWALLLDASGEVTAADRVVKYDPANATAMVSDASGAVTYMGDNRTGAGDGDDEQIKIDLAKLPSDVNQVLILVNIYDSVNRRQTFAGVNNAFVRMVVDGESAEKANFSLTANAGAADTVVFARIVRSGSGPLDWDFEPIEEFAPSLAEALKPFGIDL